ncbi:MAG: serine hydrolase domain-containing protein [Gemmatimonadaceae bacterium]
MINRTRSIAIALSGIAYLVSCSGSRDSAATSRPTLECTEDSVGTDLRSVLGAMVARNPVPAVGVAVFVPSQWKAPVTAELGMTEIGGGHPLTPDDRFLAGSVGKTFFAALALRRAAAGHLPLDSSLATLLPRVRIPALAWITPRMLLTHTSGVGEYDREFMTVLVQQPLRERQPDDWLDVLRRSPPAVSDTGVFRYSDLNYVLLAMVLDAGVTNGAYESIASEYLRPLGLSGTVASTSPRVDGLVGGYESAGSMFGRDAMLHEGALIYNPQFEWGGGGFASTPRDLARWMAAFRLGEAFPSSEWPAVIAKPAGVPDSAMHWRGMGIHVDSGALGVTLGHSGYMPGYVSWMRWYEPLGVSISMQSNATDTLRLRDDGFDWLDSIAVRVAARCPRAEAVAR